MPKYGIFKRLAHRTPMSVERKQAQFRPPDVEREYMYNVGTFANIASLHS